MNEAQQSALARAFALRNEGKTWAEIEKVMASDGFEDSRGKPYTVGNLKATYSKRKGKAPSTEAPAVPNTVDKAHAERRRKRPDTLTRKEVSAMLEALETRLRELIETKVGAARPEPDISAAFPTVEEPPLPPKTGKKFRGSKSDVRVRVDENLGKLFDADVNQRFGGNASRCMDAILWTFYGKPKLSFEQ